MLLVTQALAVATGAIPVYLLGRRHLRSDWAAAGFGLAYLLHPATQWLVLDDFHPVALATPLLLWGFWFLDSDRLVAFGVVAALACLTKEQIGLVVAVMGLWYALRPGRRRAGLAIAVAGTVVSLVAVAVVVPHFAPGGGSPFREPVRRRRRLAGRDRDDDAHRPGGDRLRAHERPRPRLPRAPDPATPGAAAPRAPRRAHGRAGAPAQPALRHAHADVDPLPLHGRRAPGAVRRRGARRRTVEAALRVGEPAGGTGRRRVDVRCRSAPRPPPGLAGRAVRLRPRDARAHRRASRQSRRESDIADPARCACERDEHARRPPLRATPSLQLPRARRGDLGRGRRAAAELPRSGGLADAVRAGVRGASRERPVPGRVRPGRHRRPSPQSGIVCGSRYAVSASAATRARRSSSSGAASGTAQARYQTAR